MPTSLITVEYDETAMTIIVVIESHLGSPTYHVFYIISTHRVTLVSL